MGKFKYLAILIISLGAIVFTSCCEPDPTSKVTMEMVMNDDTVLTRTFRVPTNASFSLRTEKDIQYLYGYYGGENVLKVPKVKEYKIVTRIKVHDGNDS